jgi:hypothetical protein
MEEIELRRRRDFDLVFGFNDLGLLRGLRRRRRRCRDSLFLI